MRAVDTNVVVRYLTGDEPGQAARARAVIEGGEVFVGTTVLLESEWVLRSVYGFSGGDVAVALRAFAGLPGVSAEDPGLLAGALDLAEDGMDFADALHLGAAGGCEAMLTFDRGFIGKAKDVAVRVTEPEGSPCGDGGMHLRILFTILVSNNDDHLKNHGLLYAGEGNWALAPVFDINPQPFPHRELKTGISEFSGFLIRSPRNAERLRAAIAEIDRGDVVSCEIVDGEVRERLQDR